MAMSALETALQFVLRWEGGFVDHRDDPGGRTNRGVTQGAYDNWRIRQGQSRRDVKDIEDAEVHAIYRTDYWLPPRCDLLPSPLDLVQFDTAVNMGVRRSVRFLQECIGCRADGDFGPATQRAASGCDTGAVLAAYCTRREDHYRLLVQKNPRLAVFMKGWMNRLNALRREAGLPGPESRAAAPDFGDTNYIGRVSDEGDDPPHP